MRILVFSDSHSTMWFMRRCIEAIKPDTIVHLGDHYDDGETLSELYPRIPLIQVPGNCDAYRCPPAAPMAIFTKLGGVPMYMTHGHNHGVKMSTFSLLQDARKLGAAAALYGHTHVPECRREADGLWVLNPGAAGNGGRSAAIIETDGSKIVDCVLINEEDLEAFV